MYRRRFESDHTTVPQDWMCFLEAAGPKIRRMPQYHSPLRKYFSKHRPAWLQLIAGRQKISLCNIALSKKSINQSKRSRYMK
jgi:hypothetical protein